MYRINTSFIRNRWKVQRKICYNSKVSPWFIRFSLSTWLIITLCLPSTFHLLELSLQLKTSLKGSACFCRPKSLSSNQKNSSPSSSANPSSNSATSPGSRYQSPCHKCSLLCQTATSLTLCFVWWLEPVKNSVLYERCGACKWLTTKKKNPFSVWGYYCMRLKLVSEPSGDSFLLHNMLHSSDCKCSTRCLYGQHEHKLGERLFISISINRTK